MNIDLKQLFVSEQELDQKTFNTLLKAIKDKHQEGFDYLRFRQSVKNLERINSDEEMAIKSAYLTAATMGLTKDKLLASSRYYKTILEKERESFAEAMRNHFNQRVESRKQEAQKLKEKIDEYQRKIERMQEEMALYKKKIDSVDDDIREAQNRIEATREKFETSYNALTEIIEKDILKFDAILS